MNKNNPNRISASQKTFSTYTKHITEEILATYGPSYSTPETVKNSWRHKTPYKKEIEDFLIFKSKMFIRLLDPRDSNSTNPEFLKALITLIADYLSAYTHKNSEIPTRKKAKELLFRTLYNQSAYIQNLLAIQAEKRTRRDYKQAKYVRENKRKQNNTKNIQQDFNNKKQIKIKLVGLVYIKNK